ncbi:MAG: WbqC family protein [Paracoccaceae bacterium]
MAHDKMNIGIMQPYFLPYIGYFQLIAHVDKFVVYDKIKFTKKGWMNRNRMLRNGEPVTFSIPVTKASDFLDVHERSVSESFEPSKLINQIKGNYAKAPMCGEVMPLIEKVVGYQSENLFDFIFHSIQETCLHLEIDTPLSVSSEVESASGLRSEDRVMGLCGDLGASVYTNPIGGVELYDPSTFKANGIELRFLRSENVNYGQFNAPFQPALSILDVIMFNDPDRIAAWLREGYSIVEKDDP